MDAVRWIQSPWTLHATNSQNCPECLHRMELVVSAWYCEGCRVAIPTWEVSEASVTSEA